MANSYLQFAESFKVTQKQLEFVQELQKKLRDFMEKLGSSDNDYTQSESYKEELAYFSSIFNNSYNETEEDLLYFLESNIDAVDIFCAPATTLMIKNPRPEIHVTSEEGGDPFFAALILKAMLENTNDSKAILSFTWAGSCDKLRAGEFGGGWVVVTKDDIYTGDTWSEADRRVRNIKKRGRNAKEA